MDYKPTRARLLVVLAVVLAIFLLFSLTLIDLQIVGSAYYSDLATMGATRSQTIPAARGEITDRYGRPIVQNKVGYNVLLDRAYLPRGEENEIILRLLRLLSSYSEEWVDKLPITQNEPFAFYENREGDISRLKKFLEVGDYTSAPDVLSWLVERYKLEAYDAETQRILAGIRYEMERQGFSVATPYTLAEDIQTETVIQIKERSYELSGVMVLESTIREYVAGDVAPHLIGQIGPIYANEYEALKNKGYAMNDTIGKSGIEGEFESTLRGTNGKRTIWLNSNGEVINAAVTESPVPGNSIMLTLDLDLQRVAQNALQNQISWLQQEGKEGEGKEAKAGAVVAIDVKTGEILAMANYPSYNLQTYNAEYNNLLADPAKPLFNRCLNGTYAAGSIYKPIVGAAGLEEGTITSGYTYTCDHVYTFYEDYQPTCLGWHPNFNIVNALRVSCNIFFYDLGRRLGIDTFNRYAEGFGLAQKTGIELSEATGHLASPAFSKSLGKTWVPGDTLQAAIGQGDNAFTPLQLASYTTTLANGGTRLETHLIKSVKSYSLDQTIHETEPVVASRVDLSENTIRTIREGMVLASGYNGTSGMYFGDYPISVASKTGTPQTSGYPNGTYICYAPAEDPQIAIAVVIESGYHGYWGAAVAKDILDFYFFGRTNDQLPTTADTLLP